MTKGDLVAAVANAAGISKKAAADAVDGLVNTVMGALKKGDSVTMVGFGTFRVADRAARKGVNPQTGATINISARKAPVFKAGKAFKEAVN